MRKLDHRYTQMMVDKSDDFARKWYNTSYSHYGKRGQYDKEKIISDHANGKLAELGIFVIFKKLLGLNPTRPDFEIYSRGKTFDADMKLGNFNLHSKSCSSFSSFRPSWIFQYGGEGSGHTDPIMANPKETDYVVFCVVDKRTKEISIKAIINAKTLKEKGLYSYPQLERLRNTKRAVYYDDILKLSEADRWSFVIQAEKQSS